MVEGMSFHYSEGKTFLLPKSEGNGLLVSQNERGKGFYKREYCTKNGGQRLSFQKSDG